MGLSTSRPVAVLFCVLKYQYQTPIRVLQVVNVNCVNLLWSDGSTTMTTQLVTVFYLRLEQAVPHVNTHSNLLPPSRIVKSYLKRTCLITAYRD
jgi:hypothetical protein